MPDDQTVNAFFSLQLPEQLVDALLALQRQHPEQVDPQQRDQLHLTLAFVHDAGPERVEQAKALVTERSWPTPTMGFSGEVRHGSWVLSKDPDYHYDRDVIQRGEQIRIGVRATPEIVSIQAGISRELALPEEEFWPHVTLGLARADTPASWADDLDIPTGSAPAPSLELQRQVTPTEFTVLAHHPF